jgi:tetratricopeptide (TPR) repeat protein
MTRTITRPYPGARPFAETEGHFFFGRGPDAEALRDMWQDNRFSLLSGPAGSGKTSLLHAGVYPLIFSKKFDVLPAGSLSYGPTFPVAALPDHNPYTLALLRTWSPGESPSRLVGLTIADFVRRRGQRTGKTLLGVLDQAEGLFVDSRPRWNLQRQFLHEFAAVIRDHELPLHLLLVTRDEALDRFTRALGHGPQHDLTVFGPQLAEEAVANPAATVGRRFAPSATTTLVSDLRTADEKADEVEPVLLQIACAALWEKLPEAESEITVRDIRRYGDVDSALAAHYGQVLAEVAELHEVSTTRLRSWLLSTFASREDMVCEGPADTEGMSTSAVRLLADQHVLSTGFIGRTRWYRLLSDRLVPALRQIHTTQTAPLSPTRYLKAAMRAYEFGELMNARRFADSSLDAAGEDEFGLHAEAESLLGNLAIEEGKPGQAEEHYREAALGFEAVGKTQAVARELAARGQVLVMLGRLPEAVIELRAAVARLPNDPLVQTELGLALWRQGDGRAAVAVLTTVLGSDAGNPEALRARGEILADIGDARAAIRDLERVPMTDRPSIRAAHALAVAGLGDYARAAKEIERVITEAPHNGPALLYAARATELIGDQPGAGELARAAMDATDPMLSPQDLQVARDLAGK